MSRRIEVVPLVKRGVVDCSSRHGIFAVWRVRFGPRFPSSKSKEQRRYYCDDCLRQMGEKWTAFGDEVIINRPSPASDNHLRRGAV